MVKHIKNLKRHLYDEFKKAEGKWLVCRYISDGIWSAKGNSRDYFYLVEEVKISWDGDPTLHFRRVVNDIKGQCSDPYLGKIVYREVGNISLGRRSYLKLKNWNWQNCEFEILNKKELTKRLIVEALEKQQ